VLEREERLLRKALVADDKGIPLIQYLRGRQPVGELAEDVAVEEGSDEAAT